MERAHRQSEQIASSDEGLVEWALSGDADAFRPIVERYQSAVFAVALSKARDYHLAEDISQYVFLEVYQKLDSLKDSARLVANDRSQEVRKRDPPVVTKFRFGKRGVMGC